MRPKPHRQKFRSVNNDRELHKTGGKIPHSSFRTIKHGGVSSIPGMYSFPSNIAMSTIPSSGESYGGKIRRYRGNGFFDDVGNWFKNLFSRSNTNQIASNLLKKAMPFVTTLAGDILSDQALHANPLDTIKRHTYHKVKNLFNQPKVEGGAVRKSTNTRAKAAYKKYVKKTKGGAILKD